MINGHGHLRHSKVPVTKQAMLRGPVCEREATTSISATIIVRTTSYTCIIKLGHFISGLSMSNNTNQPNVTLTLLDHSRFDWHWHNTIKRPSCKHGFHSAHQIVYSYLHHYFYQKLNKYYTQNEAIRHMFNKTSIQNQMNTISV